MGKKIDKCKHIKVQFLGATKEVTGSMFLVTMPNNLQILVDCGLMQKNDRDFEKIQKINAREFEFDISKLSYVILTHAHIDHIGRLPLLVKHPDFNAKIITTQATAEFAYLNLPDCAYLNGLEVEKVNKHRSKNKLQQLYSMNDAYNAIDLLQCYDFNKIIHLDEYTTIELKKAGHLLGATMVKINYNDGEIKKSVLFTGDTSGKCKTMKHPFIPDVDDIGTVDAIISESTYGDRTHRKINHLDILTKSIQETCIDRRRTLIIPVFSIGRSSDLLYLLRETYNLADGKFDEIPIYLDTPMGCKAQKVIDRNREYWSENSLDRDEELGNLFEWEQITFINDDIKMSKSLANGEPKIILSSSGMCHGGRIVNHLTNFLPSKYCKVLFCGYQAQGTLGRNILETRQKTINIDGRPIRINAVREMMEYSSHSDKQGLIELYKTANLNKLQKIILVHGELEQSLGLQKNIEDILKIETIVPNYKEIIKI